MNAVRKQTFEFESNKAAHSPAAKTRSSIPTHKKTNAESFELSITRNTILNGIIFSELLGKPKSRR